MDTTRIDVLRSRLENDRERLLREIGELRDHAVKATTYLEDENDVYDNHPADDASSLVGRQTGMVLLDNLERALADTESALVRIGSGSFGACEVCGGPIAERRLEARPAAPTCIDCQSAIESRSRRESALKPRHGGD